MRLKAKEFEEHCLERMRFEEGRGRGTMSRYGVMAWIEVQSTGVTWNPQKSLPDFEGVLPPLGRQFICDCKVCSKSHVKLADDHVSELQVRHMLRRSRFGVVCFLLIHWNERVLVTKSDPAETFAFPVYDQHPFWLAFLADEGKRTINREDCRRYGVPVDWNLATERSRIPRPDILAAVWRLLEKELPQPAAV